MGSVDVGRYGLWLLRALWLALPVVVGLGSRDAIGALEQPLIAEVALWAVWFATLVACLVPGPVSLTAVRIAAPAIVVVAGLALLADGGSSSGSAVIAAYGLLVTAVAYLARVGDEMINGSAYGSERRMALRPPGYALLGPVQVAWLMLVAGMMVPLILAATGRWLAAGLVVGPGLFGCWLGWRVLDQLARRWLVFVPAGFVIHDHLLAAESILMQRTIVAALGPATELSLAGAEDLSGGASGLALEVSLKEPVQFGRRQRSQVITTDATSIVFTPTLPGAVLSEARIRAIRIGQAS